MNYSIFSSEIWKSKVYYPDKKKLIKIIERKYKENPEKTPKGWSCSVHSSFKPSDIISAEVPKELIKIILEKIEEFLKIHNDSLWIHGEYYIVNIWYNAYSANQFQEIHTHGESLFSGCYYLKFDKKIHYGTTFYNPNFNVSFLGLEENNFFSFTPECDEDDIIIFPSFLPHKTHGLKDKYSDNLRITISFNIMNDALFHDRNKIKIFYQ